MVDDPGNYLRQDHLLIPSITAGRKVKVAMGYSFKGYMRSDGSAGTRNNIGIISSVICSSTVTNEIASKIDYAVPIVHSNGCAQLGDDFSVTKSMLSGVAENPNFHSNLLIGLGCETNQVTGLLAAIPNVKPIDGFSIQQMAGGTNTVAKGVAIASEWSKDITNEQRTDLPISKLKIGVITTDMDEQTLAITTPVVSALIDELLENDSTVICSLTRRLEPSGKILATKTKDTRSKEMLKTLSEGLNRRRWENDEGYALSVFSDEEKSLAAHEARLLGSKDLVELLNINEKPSNRGLYLLKSSDNIVETISNFVSVGCNVALIISKEGILTTSNVIPCISLAPCNESQIHRDHVDFYIARGNEEKQTVTLLEKLLQVSSGELTALEEYELGEFAIPHIGTTF
ncbi:MULTISPECIES: UxaA family hydrolase [unclassified Sporosarcina]|uniref:UxaA family hydrolase n=1 Tax=unclassified Sporosarcina TaxID=2647733 RepID=UPI000C16CF68|nr:MULTISPECIES: UxaA family hydrolase [unclassified Sporosarcina]PIC98583.1 altronate hydrolase [Sporosarcina sp. P29]PID06010.1 altronate hydrolase [Sporosarcina sp. P30]PID09204.1 altronate hydrolase [Sporosarcina sp. P31]PID12502.1 altronate hydrolase [Sporosarcina sp. P32b]